jgi:hypothetical protein
MGIGWASHPSNIVCWVHKIGELNDRWTMVGSRWFASWIFVWSSANPINFLESAGAIANKTNSN